MTAAASPELLQKSGESIAHGSKSFAAAAKLFPRNIRSDATMLYAWCRYADDMIDGQTAGYEQQPDFRQGQRQRLEELRRTTRSALEGEVEQGSVFHALQLVVGNHRIPHRHPMELVRGFEMDVEGRSYHDLEDTLEYCYHVAGVVGVMMSMIMGARDPETLDRASDLGIALQLTNIARDVMDDARAGRIYLPQDWLDEYGLSGIDPADRDQWPKLHACALRLLDAAEPYYQSAFAGLAALPWRSAWAIAAARRVYREIGVKLRSGGSSAWENRIATSKSRKLWLLLASLQDVGRTRFAAGDVPRQASLYERPESA
jgi:phytoene synthase